MQNKVKLLCSLSLAFLILSCSTTEPNLVEIKGKKPEKVEQVVKLKEQDNEKILKDETMSKIVFDRHKRKINQDLKGVWVSTVFGLDFSKTKNYDMEKQKQEIDEIVKNVKDWGLNAIFLQVKPSNAVIYPSKVHPWDACLTGVEGVDPGYDPLKYFVTKAHENNIELHAWINPYRAALTTDLSKLSNRNVVKQHPDWVFEFKGKLYLNPGKPEVVKHLYQNIEEIVKNYDVDGVHLDDYFYPYPNQGEKIANFDEAEYEKYGKQYPTIEDYRRANVDDLIKNLSVSVHKIKPELSFGVSPFGIWRNAKKDERGSLTDGLAAYDDLYADIVKWMENGWIDYVAPQIYWEIGHKKADYKTLVNWWSKEAEKTNTPLYIGEGVYKYAENNWSKDELIKHRDIRKANPSIKGYILFRYETLKNNPKIVEEMR